MVKSRSLEEDGTGDDTASPPPGQPPMPPVPAPAAVWDDDALLNPFQESLEEGRNIGKVEGEASGYAEGLQVGRLTGIEHGMEVGFLRGVVQAIRENVQLKDPSDADEVVAAVVHDRSSTRIRNHPDRLRKTLRDLEALLDAFPVNEPPSAATATPPQSVASQSTAAHGVPLPSPDNENDNDNGNENADDDELPTANEALQQIRAQSKLLAAQLGLSHRTVSLAAVLEDKEARGGGARATAQGESGGIDFPTAPSQHILNAQANAAAIAEW